MAEYKYIKYDKDGMGEFSDTPGPGRSKVIGTGKSRAGAGRGRVNPPDANPQRSAAEKEMLQEAQDTKDRKKISDMGYKKGGAVKKMAAGGMTASQRADGCAQRGKTRA
jgi:hypothetical protein